MRYPALLFTVLLLAGCLSAQAANPASTPRRLPTQVPAGGLLYLPLESTGTPEANPTLTVEAAIIDAVTHQPVLADLYIIHTAEYRPPTSDELALRAIDQFALQLPAQSDSWLVVRAPGYEDWTLRLHYQVKTSRKLSGPVQLQRLPAERKAVVFHTF